MSKKKRNKFSINKKEQIILSILQLDESCNSIARKYQTSHRLISLWVDCYKQHGKMGLSFNNRMDYSGSYKIWLIKQMKEEGLSLHQMSAQYLISLSSLSLWSRQYEQFGALSLLETKPRGRPPKMPQPKRKKSNKPASMEELVRENERLRAENDYLKKLQALIQKQEASDKDNEPRSSKN